MNPSDVEATPDRRPTSKFRTPHNPNWSPIFHAVTPDLNSPPTELVGKTPALQLSLGIQPELDTSWMSSMATPSAGPDLKPEILDKSDDKKKALYKRNLFQRESTSSDELGIDPEPVVGFTSPQRAGSCGTISCAKLSDQSNAAPVMSNKEETVEAFTLDFLRKRPSVFIYPDPVHIDLHCGRPSIGIPFKTEPAPTAPNTASHIQVVNSSVLSQGPCMPSKEIRRNFQCLSGERRGGDSEVSGEALDMLLLPATKEDRVKELSTEDLGTTREKPPNATTHVSLRAKNTFTDGEDAPASLINAACATVAIDFGKSNSSFCSASGKNIAVSKSAIARAQCLFDNIDDDRAPLPPAITTNRTAGVNLPSGENVTASKESVANVEKWFDKADCKLSASSALELSAKTAGFNFASGKSVMVSKEAMSKAKELFDSIDDMGPSSSAETANKSAARSSDSDSRKRGAVSEEASAKARGLFNNFATDSSCLPAAGGTNALAGFNFASGKNVTVSKEAMDKVKGLFDNIDGEEPASLTSRPSKLTGGFNTASGKAVAVSKEALARAKGLFDAIDGDEAVPPKLESVHRVVDGARSSVTSSCITVNGSRAVTSTGTLTKTTAPLDNIVDDESSLRSRAAESSVSHQFSPPKNIQMPAPSHSRMPSYAKDVADSHAVESARPLHRKRKLADEDDESVDDIPSSPTIGKKKRKKPKSSPISSAPSSTFCGTPSLFEQDPTVVDSRVLMRRRRARLEQKGLIHAKQSKSVRVVSRPGNLFQLKSKSSDRKKWTELIGNSSLPDAYQPYQLLQQFGVIPDVVMVQPTNAAAFNFCAWEYFSLDDCRSNSQGLELGEFSVILSDDNTIGFDEIASALLACEGVDPALVSTEWIRNHYRWIVWKLAAIELRVPSLFARQALTPLNVLEQLKYRYDVEIDRCKRSALKRIIEQDDSPAKTMILCVAEVKLPNVLVLTDGWYSIDAHCDPAMGQLIDRGKIFVGVKLAVSGAELSSPGPTSPLEKGADTFLKISSNSSRRARWDAKMGYYANPKPIAVSLNSVLPDGGLVSELRVTIVRVYPLVYMEKLPDGKKVFHSERNFRRISENSSVQHERMMAKVMEDVEREEDERERKKAKTPCGQSASLTEEDKRNNMLVEVRKRMESLSKSAIQVEGLALLKIRVVDWQSTDVSSAIVSVWRPSEDIQHHLKENKSFKLYKTTAAGLRCGELQLNSGKHTLWKETKEANPQNLQGLERNVTSFEATSQPGFKPIFNEIDIVGLVVYVEEQLKKGAFQTIVLSDGSNLFGIKCWGNLEEFALVDIVVAGAFVAFSNLQWRPTTTKQSSGLRFAFVHEGTLVSTRPAQKHLDAALSELKQTVRDPESCVAEAEVQVTGLLGNVTPQSASTSRFGSDRLRSGGNAFTPKSGVGIGIGSVSNRNDTPISTHSNKLRARQLEKFGTPPALAPWSATPSPHVRQKFKPPARKLPPPS